MTTSSLPHFGAAHNLFRAMDVAECVELLASKRVGRVGFIGPHNPQVIPVNYALSDGAVVFRTAAYGTLAQHATRARVAFEVDELDEFLSSGWSVLALRTAESVSSDDVAK